MTGAAWEETNTEQGGAVEESGQGLSAETWGRRGEDAPAEANVASGQM